MVVASRNAIGRSASPALRLAGGHGLRLLHRARRPFPDGFVWPLPRHTATVAPPAIGTFASTAMDDPGKERPANVLGGISPRAGRPREFSGSAAPRPDLQLRSIAKWPREGRYRVRNTLLPLTRGEPNG